MFQNIIDNIEQEEYDNYENEVKKITKYESKQYMSDKTFILKNRSLYETKEDGDIALKKDIGYAIPWDVPRRLTNEFKSC